MRLVIHLNSDFDFWRIQQRHVDFLHEAFPDLSIKLFELEKPDWQSALSEADYYYGWQFRDNAFERCFHQDIVDHLTRANVPIRFKR